VSRRDDAASFVCSEGENVQSAPSFKQRHKTRLEIFLKKRLAVSRKSRIFAAMNRKIFYMIRIIVLLVGLCPAWLTATAQNVYEDSWDLWPYSFLNDKGEPDGFNIDLIKMMMKELGIPYVIKLKPQQEAFQDLKAGKSDLTLGLAVGFHDEFGLYGRNAITLFTQSVVTPKSKPVEIKTFRDLNKPGLKVIVNDSSLCHHLMLDYGWTEHAIVSHALAEMAHPPLSYRQRRADTREHAPRRI